MSTAPPAPASPSHPDGTEVPAATAAAIAASDAADAAQAAVTEAQVAADAAEDVSESGTVLPFRARTRTLIAILVAILVLYTCFLARELIVPVLLAVFFALCGNPIVARLQRLLVPRFIGALLVVAGTLTAAGVAGSYMLTPAAEWLRQAPRELRQHVPKLRELTKPFEEATKATESIEKMADVGPPAPAPVRVVEPSRRNWLTMLAAAPRMLASLLAVLILSYFFMVYGEDLLRRFVTVVPGWRQKRITVDILRSIQNDISRYMLTITLINAGVAVATALALWGIGLDVYDAMLWGAIAGAFNFAPYVGPLVAAIAFTLVGLVAFDNLAQAMLVPGAFLVLHLIEGQFVTPLILGQRMAISPVILLLWLFLWGWMWGIAGLLLAVPMLVCFKIYCSRVEGMKGWAMMMEP
jgi:predicted PurR-regulated permease PerM